MLSYTEYQELQSVEVSNDSSVDDYENELSEYGTRIKKLKEQKSKSENNVKQLFKHVMLQKKMNNEHDKGERVYTSKKVGPVVNSTQSAHPAKFSLIDQYSSQRLKLKRRYGLFLTQIPFTKC
ncbi:unnamed protein product [Adineta steineri]|uniref:Nucleolar protein 10 n=1 Tax=Adineta steineri TaxID=433720 RepID=A0A818UHA9_9BILA|nr:unnamed protein product [Adineta steineri]